MRWMLICVTSMAVVLSSVDNVRADELPWPDRGGPNTNGVVAAEQAKNLPSEWDEESGKNIAWKIAIKHHGHSTPVIGEGRVWLTSATEDGTQQFIICIDEQSGEILHEKLLFENEEPEPLNNKINTYASPSCVLVPGAVFVHFGSYGTAKLNSKTAEVIWQRRDIECLHFRGPGSSPVLFEDLLICTYDGVDHQFLNALNTKTGKTVWRTERSTDYGDLDENGEPKAGGDYRKAYNTPGLVVANGKTQVVSVGSRAAFGYDARTGKELWTITHDDFNAAARPSFYNDHAIINTGSRGANMIAVKLDESTLGNVDKTHITWNRERGNSRLSTPVLYKKRIYMIADNGVATCLNADDGEVVWTGRVGGNFVASPIVANDLIYFCSEDGETAIIETGDEFKIVRKNKLETGTRSSPSVANGALFLRTFSHLYKIASE